MSRGVLIGIIVVLAAVGGFFAYKAYEKDQNTFSIEIGSNGVKIDTPK